MTAVSQSSPAARAKLMAVQSVIKELRPHLAGIEITAEERTFSWRPPFGFNWSKTIDPKVAIHGATKRLHIVVSPGTGDLYYYK